MIRPFTMVCFAVNVGLPMRMVAQPSAMTGTWVASRDTPTTVALAPSAVFGERVALLVRAGDVSITRVLRGASVVSILPSNGGAVRTVLPGRSCMGDGVSIGSLTKAGEILTYTQSTMQAGSAQPSVASTYIVRLESPDRLVVESTMRVSAQDALTQVGTVYHRSSESLPAVAPSPAVRGAAASIAGVSWMTGDWAGPSGAATVEERWAAAAGGAMLAVSRTTRTGTMSAFEFLCMAERNGSLVYTARPNGDAPTDFTLTHIDADSATFENPEHDFPKRIRYVKRTDGSMAATISGAAGQRPTTFVFTRRGPGA